MAAVSTHLPEADHETVRVVAAMAGLLGATAYADRDYSEAEERAVRGALGRVQGMTAEGIDAVCGLLRQNIVEISTVQAPRYCRALRELGDHELRVQVLGLLVDLAAADGALEQSEVNLLRQTAVSLGLTQDDYNAAQKPHRDKLTSLR